MFFGMTYYYDTYLPSYLPTKVPRYLTLATVASLSRRCPGGVQVMEGIVARQPNSKVLPVHKEDRSGRPTDGGSVIHIPQKFLIKIGSRLNNKNSFHGP